MRPRALAALWLCATAAGLVLVYAGWSIRSPVLMDWRPWPVVALCALALALAAAAWRAARGAGRALRLLAAAPGLLALAAGLWREGGARWLEHSVMAAPSAELRAVARHLIVGFDSFANLDPLVVRAGVAGIFVARHNVRNLDAEALAREIGRLQGLRRAAGLPPLRVATEQEGGPASALSPPLPPPAALSTLSHAGELVINATQNTARDLACAGINVNFAPVVDVSRRANGPGDPATQISRRAISSDERVVAGTARDYCRVLADSGVQCTLKHFPGVGAVKGDTRLDKASLPELLDMDLYPFREITSEDEPWIMLGHVSIDALEDGLPASASPRLIGVLRDDWGFSGVLVTDDVSMAAYALDFERNIVATMSGGADLVFVSRDPDLIYETLDILLRERRNNPVFAEALSKSDARLARAPPGEPACRRLAAR